MKPLRLHVLYEHGSDLRPFGSAYIRLLRPLTHPVFQGQLEVTVGRIYDGSPVDAVIVDRLWRPDISPVLVEQLREQTRRVGAKLLYALDDNLLELAQEHKDWQPTEAQIQSLALFLAEADGLLVTTQSLQAQLHIYNLRIAVIPNMLDDRLLDGRGITCDVYPLSLRWRVRRALTAAVRAVRAVRQRRTLIGYMGTFTHDEDLLMVLPALREVSRRHRDTVAFVVLGVAMQTQTLTHLQGLPVQVIRLEPRCVEYPYFMQWFSRTVQWDIAISPLRDNRFNRCKSDIKFLDYSAIGAAGIYSRGPAYAGTVRHRETGWLVENTIEAWIDALEILINDVALRKRIACNATDYLYTERIVTRSATDWLTAFERLLG